jgi:hypothetical protein
MRADCEIVRLKLCCLGPMETIVLIVGCWSYVSQLVMIAVSDVADCDCLMTAEIGTIRYAAFGADEHRDVDAKVVICSDE